MPFFLGGSEAVRYVNAWDAIYVEIINLGGKLVTGRADSQWLRATNADDEGELTVEFGGIARD